MELIAKEMEQVQQIHGVVKEYAKQSVRIGQGLVFVHINVLDILVVQLVLVKYWVSHVLIVIIVWRDYVVIAHVPWERKIGLINVFVQMLVHILPVQHQEVVEVNLIVLN